MIRVGSKVPPLPPMRDARQICIDALAAIRGGVALTGAHVRGLVEFAHPDGQSRACEAVAILAHLCADRNPNGLKDMFDAKRLEEKAKSRAGVRTLAKRMQKVDETIDAIRAAKKATIQRGETFTIEDLRPIIEKALS